MQRRLRSHGAHSAATPRRARFRPVFFGVRAAVLVDTPPWSSFTALASISITVIPTFSARRTTGAGGGPAFKMLLSPSGVCSSTVQPSDEPFKSSDGSTFEADASGRGAKRTHLVRACRRRLRSASQIGSGGGTRDDGSGFPLPLASRLATPPTPTQRRSGGGRRGVRAVEASGIACSC
eukprot:scaffold30611_cov35-Tisochrysis_lutea.AAC.2